MRRQYLAKRTRILVETEEWPIKEPKIIEDLLEPVLCIVCEVIESPTMSSIMDVNRFSAYDKLIRTTARLLSVFNAASKYSLMNVRQIPSQYIIQKAEFRWIKECQLELTEAFKKGKFNSLSPAMRSDGIIAVGSRATEWMEMCYDKEALPLIPGNHLLARLHAGTSTVVAQVRLQFWVTRAQKIATSIRHNCITCRKKGKELSTQVMGDLPDYRLKPAPAWYNTGDDYFGPFIIKGEVNQRSRGKCY